MRSTRSTVDEAPLVRGPSRAPGGEKSFASRSDSESSRTLRRGWAKQATASAFRSITTSAPTRTRARSDAKSFGASARTRESQACSSASILNFSPTSVHERPNTTENRGVPDTREQDDSTTCTTYRKLQNLHPRFKSGRRLQNKPFRVSDLRRRNSWQRIRLRTVLARSSRCRFKKPPPSGTSVRIPLSKPFDSPSFRLPRAEGSLMASHRRGEWP
jgi:hypothetical protein